MRKTWFLVVLAALLVACSGGGQEDQTALQAPAAQPAADPYAVQPTTPAAAAPAASAPAAPAGGAVVALGDCGQLGQCLTNAAGRVLYAFADDTQNSGTSACTGDCLTNWPSWTSPNGPPTVDPAATGVNPALLTTITGSDGQPQVSINGWPLYFYAGDAGPGTWNGQGVGDKWYVLNAAGQLVREPPAGGAAAPAPADDAYGAAAPAAPGGAAPAGPDIPEIENVAIEVGNSAYGQYLRTDGDFTLYFKADEPRNQLTCTGGCQERYAPLRGSATAEPGVNAEIATTPEGYVTVNGWIAYRRVREETLQITGSPGWQMINPAGEGFTGEDGGGGGSAAPAPAAPAPAAPAADDDAYGY